jgi:ribosomal protein L29
MNPLDRMKEQLAEELRAMSSVELALFSIDVMRSLCPPSVSPEGWTSTLDAVEKTIKELDAEVTRLKGQQA